MTRGPVEGKQLAAGAAVGARGVKFPMMTKTVYFVRHGQAMHNVVEEHMKMQAAAEAEARGHAKGSEAFHAYLKEARAAVLSDTAFLDAALSDRGRAQCLEAKREIASATQGHKQLSPPTTVLVSPLLRTLQSAAIMFPGHPKVRVCGLLRERRTGLPCDELSPAGEATDEFRHMDFTEAWLPAKMEGAHGAGVAAGARAMKEEDAAQLRSRTACLAELLRHVEDEAICVVTHKGFLRELERGPLGRSGAKEFRPAELRAYKVRLFADGGLEAVACFPSGATPRVASAAVGRC